MEPESETPPTYPWKAEGPEFELRTTYATAVAVQPPTFYDHIGPYRVCVKCRIIVDNFLGSVFHKSVTHYDFKTLRISASRGCPVCRFFYHEVALQPHLQNLEQNQDSPMEFLLNGESLEIIDFSSKSRLFEIYERRDGILQDGLSRSTPLRDIQPHPLSEDCWNIAENWLKDCTSAHENCAQSTEWPLPTRIIDVRNDRPILVHGSGISAPYTALSHCWGQVHHPLSYTTSQTLRDFQSGIDIFDLPATYRDAIEVTRRLNIRYLWIDSLCIIQDSIEDWKREAQRMGSYYQNCFLNISALDAPDSNTGFLIPRQNSPTVQLQGTFYLHGNLYLRPAQRTWRQVFDKSPLSRRAWVLQERLVSTRVLHYGRDDMFWECLTCSTRESDITESRLADQEVGWLDENFKRSLQFPPADQGEAQVEFTKILHKWYRIVSQYSRLLMSHESDMLPAISAIAERIKHATGYTYLYGLWIEDLHQGLLWYADGPRSVPRIWRAPSWSWAQLTGPILHILGPHITRKVSKYDLKFLATKPITTQSYGAESTGTGGAELSVLGYTAPVWLKNSHRGPPYNNPSLKLVLDIYDTAGIPVGTGHLDTFIDDRPVRQCTALVVTEILDPEINQTSWLTFLLVENDANDATVLSRIGVGQGYDFLNQYIFDTKRIFEGSSPMNLTLV